MASPGAPPNIAELEGPVALGQFFSWFLFGILVVQMFIYTSNFPNERRPIRYLVLGVFTCEILQTIFGTDFAYTGMVIGWGNLDALNIVPWSIIPMPGICGIISSAVHFFYCWRIWVIAEIIILPVFIALCSLAQCAAALYCGINLGILGEFSKIGQNNNIAIVWFGGSALCDIVITVTLVVLLLKMKNTTKFTSSSSMISKLVLYTVETGMMTAIAALCTLIVFLVLNNTNMHLLFFFILSRLYANSMMASLNARKLIADRERFTVGTSTMTVNGLWRVGEAVSHLTKRSGVQIATSVEEGADTELGIYTKRDNISLSVASIPKSAGKGDSVV